MDFSFSEDQVGFQKLFKDFVKKEIEPITEKMDKEEYFPADVIKKAGELGFLGMSIPEEYGGTGMGEVSACLFNEEVAYSSPAVCTILGAHTGIACHSMYLGGTDEQKKKYLAPMARGEKLGAFALTEPTAGSDAAGIKTKAVRKGDKFVINGSKIWITNGGVADVYIIYANLEKTESSRGGITAFIAERGFPGLEVGTIEKHMGIHGSSTAELVFDNLEVPVENMLGEEGGGFAVAMGALNYGRLELGAGCVGIAKRCLHMSHDFAKQRVQFGKPIIKQQVIQFKLAEMATDLEAARLMVYNCAWLADQGKRFTKESAMVKLFCSRVANMCANEAVQIHGGMGYMSDYPVERFYRDARITEIYEGTSEIQKSVIAMQLMRERRS
ncbi:MAG TPA: acyl-CoA dehydrogenase family protein [bacterium]|nr:acyl-CoA dehydrogenase family protein [bacterium]